MCFIIIVPAVVVASVVLLLLLEKAYGRRIALLVVWPTMVLALLALFNSMVHPKIPLGIAVVLLLAVHLFHLHLFKDELALLLAGYAVHSVRAKDNMLINFGSEFQIAIILGIGVYCVYHSRYVLAHICRVSVIGLHCRELQLCPLLLVLHSHQGRETAASARQTAGEGTGSASAGAEV